MARPSWKIRLSDVLKHETVEIEKHSARTGNNYKTDVIPSLQVLSSGSVESLDNGNYKYSIVDSKVGLEYEIQAPQKISVRFGTLLEFSNVFGGETSSGGWYKAEKVTEILRTKVNA